MEGENEAPLLQPSPATAKPPKTQTQKAIRKTFKGTTRLSSLLPTGLVLIFEMLSPILTKKGQCKTLMDQTLTFLLLFFCAATCFLMCFADSVLDPRGKVHYGFATFRGLWIVDGLVRLDPDESAKYKIWFINFVHGVASVLVFIAVGDCNRRDRTGNTHTESDSGRRRMERARWRRRPFTICVSKPKPQVRAVL